MSEKESSKRIRLTVEGGPTREFSGDRAFVIGRSQNVEFTIPHPNLSREHVRISLKEGEVWMEDLGSANGTFVQGQKVPPKSIVKLKPNYRVLLGTGSNVILSFEAVEASGPLADLAPPKGDVDLPTAHERTMTSQQRFDPPPKTTDSLKTSEPSKTLTKSHAKLELDFPPSVFPQEAKKEKGAELRILEAKKQRVLEDIQYKEREVDDLRSKIRSLREESLKLKEQTESFKKEIQPLSERKVDLEERVTQLDHTYAAKIDELESGFNDLKQTLEESHAVRMARADKDYKDRTRKIDDDFARKLQELESETKAVRIEGERLRDTLLKEKREYEENLKKVRNDAATLEAERRLAQVRIDTDLAQLQGTKMKLENELENLRRKHGKVTADTNLILEQGRIEQMKLEETRKTTLAVLGEQEHLKRTIEDIKQSESKNIRRIEELKSTIQTLENKAQGIEGVIRQSEVDAETIRHIARETAESEREAVRKNAEAQAAAQIQAAEAQVNARMGKAGEDSRALLERAQNEGNQYYATKKMETDGLLTGAQSQAERIITEAAASLESRRRALEAELLDLRKRSDQEIRQVRQNAISDIEAAKERESKDFSGRLKGRVKEIGDQIDRIVGSKLAAQYGVNMDPVSMKNFSNEIHSIVETVIGAPKGTSANEVTMHTVLPTNTYAQERVVRYWKKVGIAIAAGLVLLVGKVMVPEVYTSVGKKLASAVEVKDNTDAVVKRMLRERQLAMVFVTPQDQNFRDSYTDNVLYTEGFIEMKEDDQTQKAWTLELNKFFQGELGLTEKAIVQFGSAEGRLIRTLVDLRKAIVPQTSTVGIQKMREEATPIVKEMRFIVRTEVNWNRFQNFHREFYQKYTQTFINRAPASKESAP